MEASVVYEMATRLHNARLEAKEIDRISNEIKDFSQDDAYLIQDYGIRLREKDGERVIGSKMGLTSKAKREQMGLHEAVYGVLTDKMQLKADSTHSLKGSIHPKIEPEIAFLIGEDIQGNVTREEAIKACSGVCIAMEILDSRFRDFKYFSLEDVIADNSSSSLFVLGSTIKSLKDIDVSDLKMELKVNGEVVQSGSSSAISGDPLLSIVEQCALFTKRGLTLKKGSIVLAGAATTAVALEPGMKVSLDVEKLGSVFLNIVK